MESSNPSSSKPKHRVQASAPLHELKKLVLDASLTHPLALHGCERAHPVDNRLLCDIQGSRVVESPASCSVQPMTQREYYLHEARMAMEHAKEIYDRDCQAVVINDLLEENIEDSLLRADSTGEGKIVANNKWTSNMIDKMVVSNAYSIEKARDPPVKADIPVDYSATEDISSDEDDLDRDLYRMPALNSDDSFGSSSTSKKRGLVDSEFENALEFCKAFIGDAEVQRDLVNGCPVPVKSSVGKLVPCGATRIPATPVCYKHLSNAVANYPGCCTPDCLNTVFDLFSSYCTTCVSENKCKYIEIPALPESERTPMPIPQRNTSVAFKPTRPAARPPPPKPRFLPTVQNFLRQFEELKIPEGEFLSSEALRERLVAANSEWTPEHLNRLAYRTVPDDVPAAVKTQEKAFDVLADRLEDSKSGTPDASDLYPILKQANTLFEFGEIEDPKMYDDSKVLLIPWPYAYNENYFCQRIRAAEHLDETRSRAIEAKARKKEVDREKRKKKKTGTAKTKGLAAKKRDDQRGPRFPSYQAGQSEASSSPSASYNLMDRWK